MPRRCITFSLPVELSGIQATSLQSRHYFGAETGLNPWLLSSTTVHPSRINTNRTDLSHSLLTYLCHIQYNLESTISDFEAVFSFFRSLKHCQQIQRSHFPYDNTQHLQSSLRYVFACIILLDTYNKSVWVLSPVFFCVHLTRRISKEHSVLSAEARSHILFF